MRHDQLNRRTHRTSAAAKAERHLSPQVIQRGRAVRHSDSGGRHLAYCKTDAPDSDEIECYLDTDETGPVVTVKCLIINGSSLMYAAPFLRDGDPVMVGKIDGDWYCTNIEFNGVRFG